MGLTFTRIGSSYNVFGTNVNQNVAQLSVKNTDTSNAVKLNTISINGIYYIYSTTWVNNLTDAVALDKATGKLGTWTTAQYGASTSAITVTLSITDATGTARSSDTISLGYSSANKTFTFSTPPILAANTTYNIKFTFGGTYNNEWWSPANATYLKSGETSTEVYYAREHHFSMIGMPAATNVSGTTSSADKTITLTIGTGVSSATATGGSTGSKTWTSGGQAFAGVAYDGTVKLTARTLATGYHDGTNTAVNTTFSANATLAATANTYTVEYYDGTTKKGSSSHTYGTAKALNTASSMSMSKSGWTFNGWTTSTSSTSRSYSDGQSVSNLTSTNGGTVILYAIWQRSATFYSGASKATTNTATQYYNSKGGNYSVTSPAGSAITGWTKLGFRNDTTAGAKEYDVSATITASDATYYAVYSRSVTLSYTNGGGTGTAPTAGSATQYYNSNGGISSVSFTLASNTFTRTGYTFSKWGAGNAGATYTATPDYSTSGTQALSTAAQWTGVSYSVAFNKNGGSGSMTTQTGFVYGTAKALTANAFTAPTGYYFSSWNTKSDGTGTSYADKANMTTGTSTSGGTVTLYAIWVGISYSVKFNANGGSGTMSNMSCTYGTAKALTANAFTAPTNGGYSFQGWATSASNATAGTVAYADKANMTTGTTTSGGTVNLYAVWKRTVTFKSGKAKETSSTATQYYGGNVTLPSITAITGWTTKGFRDDTTAGAKEFDTGAQAYTGAATLYAVYSRTITLTYANGGGTGTDPSNTTGTQYYNSNGSVSTVSLTLATNPYAKTGYTFSKWTDGNAGASIDKNPGVDASASFTETAVWTGITYYVAYYNDGSDLKKNSTHVYGTSSKLTTATTLGISKSGYTFYGWATADKGLTRTYTDGQSVSTLTSTSGGTVKVYAIWQKDVTFYSGASKTTTKTATLYYNNGTSSVAIPATPADISNWTALGWRADTTASSQSYSKTGSITSSTSSTFYAVYSRTLTISYNGNSNTSGSTSSTTATIYLNSNSTTTSSQTVTFASNGFAKTGYTFSKWAAGSTSGTQYSANADYTASLVYNASTFGTTMYAIWTANTYTITYSTTYGTAPASVTKAYDSSYNLPAAVTYGPTTANGYKITYNANGHGTAPSAVTMTDTTTYTFGGWNTKSDGTGTNYNAGASYTVNTTSNVTLYAKWTVTTTKGSTTLATMSTQTSGTDKFYFKGWGTSSTATTGITGDYTPTGNVTLYAVWALVDTVIISYNNNGGTGTIASLSKYRDETGFAVINGSGFTSTGYKLIGWNTNANGTGTKYKLGSTKVTLPTTGDLTLYAVWYENFVWTSKDSDNIKTGQPTTNALASKWNTLESNIKNYYDNSYTPSAVSANGAMVASKFKTAADKIGASMTTSTAGTMIEAVDFNTIATKINDVAYYVGAI